MNIVIIGASHSGTTVACDLKKIDPSFNVYLIDRQPTAEWGYVSNGINLFYQKQIDTLSQAAISLNRLKDSDVVLLDEMNVVAIDSKQKTVSLEDPAGTPQTLAYDRLVVATGSAMQETEASEQYTNLIHYKTYRESEEALTKLQNAGKIAIIGSGYIGMELADSLAAEGKQLYVIDTMKNILFRHFDPDVTDILKEAMIQQGVHYYPQQYQIEYSVKKDHIEKVVLAEEAIDVDLVVFPRALRPNTELLTGLVALNEDNTVKVDAEMRTSAPDIYATGDIVPLYDINQAHQVYLPLVNRAVRIGRTVAMSIAGLPVDETRDTKISATRLFGYYLGSCGITEEEAPYLGISVSAFQTKVPLEHNMFKAADRQQMTIKLIYDESTQVILGIQLRSSSEVIDTLNLGALILENRLTLSQLARQDFCFSPEYTQPFHLFNEVAFHALMAKRRA